MLTSLWRSGFLGYVWAYINYGATLTHKGKLDASGLYASGRTQREINIYSSKLIANEATELRSEVGSAAEL